jgi:peptidoglycan hydrolase CwlO-like protein
MPSFDTTVEFEVYCDTCGTGLCNDSSVERSRNRGYLQLRVTACPDCMKEKDSEIEDLQKQVKDLEKQLEEQSEELDNYKEGYSGILSELKTSL